MSPTGDRPVADPNAPPAEYAGGAATSGPVREPRVLIVSGNDDPHVDAVTAHLDRRGVAWRSLNLATVPDATLTYRPLTGEMREGTDDLTEFTAIWSRRWYDPGLPTVPDHYRAYGQQEFRELMMSSLLGLRARWLDFPARVRHASFKPHQLRVAARQGHFAVPDTLVTSNPEQARDFCEAHRWNVIAKSLGMPIVRRDQTPTIVYTSRLGPEAHETLVRLRFGPCILQAFVPKAWEARVTVVGERVFACRLDTTAVEGAEVDWRFAKDWFEIPHAAVEPPGRVVQGCLEMCREFGIRYGAFDFVVDPAGDWYFLEINPVGQWQWVEAMTGLSISGAIADELCRPA